MRWLAAALAVAACGPSGASLDLAFPAHDLSGDLAGSSGGPCSGCPFSPATPCSTTMDCTCGDTTFSCTGGFWQCVKGACDSIGAIGDPCQKPSQCASFMAVCIVTDENGDPWPGGYCSAPCDPANDDPNTGYNPGCDPGVGPSGVCRGTHCEAACNPSAPCARAGYACWRGGCEPDTIPRPDMAIATDAAVPDLSGATDGGGAD